MEIFVFQPEILLCGYPARGSKMFHNVVSSSMDYSNRMTVLMGYASRRSTAETIGRNMEEP
ncbi:MAG TPA: hypothetical protein H9695_00400 [Candidatus Mediterraneibacter excrementigallinarum]|nr:hypothetical protein [Candidatus Mediterraneibacter excrementigallinarum]